MKRASKRNTTLDVLAGVHARPPAGNCFWGGCKNEKGEPIPEKKDLKEESYFRQENICL